jgi:hypothetical protein
MVCICKNQLAAASAALASAKLDFSVTPPTAAMQLAAHLSLAPPQLDPDLLDALKNAQIPPFAMGAGTGTLSGLVNAAMAIKATLGISPLAPGAAMQLKAALGTLAAHGPALTMPPANLHAIGQISAAASAVAQIRAHLGIDPLMPNASLALNEALGQPAPPPPAWAIPKLQLIAGYAPLVSIANTLKLDLGAPGALNTLASHIKALAALPGVPGLAGGNVMLPKLSLLASLANIHAVTGINLAASEGPAQARAMMSQLASLKVTPPHLPAVPLPSVPNIKAVLGLGPALGPLSGLKWSIPPFSALPLLSSLLPAVSLVAQLQAVAPMLKLPNVAVPSPCGGGCPMAA